MVAQGENNDRVLGKKVENKFVYDPSLLRKEARLDNRKNIIGSRFSMPFFGMDIWHCYEVSWLDSCGKPQNFILKICYPASSEYIVESKSLKLYLNSLNQTMFVSPMSVLKVVGDDLTKLLECHVVVSAFPLSYNMSNLLLSDSRYPLLENLISKEVTINEFEKENPGLLDRKPSNEPFFVHSTSLRSRCKVTGQPDWGDLFIYMKGGDVPTFDSLYKYIISLRNECHFHEEIVETVYMRLLETFHPRDLGVFACYTRRGGIDINPMRASDISVLNLLSLGLLSPDQLSLRTIRQ